MPPKDQSQIEPPEAGLPQFCEANVHFLIDKLVYLQRNGEIEYKPFVEAAYRVDKLADSFGGAAFSKWLACGRDGAERSWSWIGPDRYNAIIKHMFVHRSWVVPYFSMYISNSQLLKMPLVQALATQPQSDQSLKAFLTNHVCGRYQIYRPSMAVERSTLRGEMIIRPAEQLDMFIVDEEFKAPGVGHWKLSGFLTARSHTLFAIMSSSETNPAPETKYITSVSTYLRDRQQDRIGDVSTMRGFVSDVHEGKRFYAAPLFIERKHASSKIVIDVVSNDELTSENRAAHHFLAEWHNNAYNPFIAYDGYI